MARRASAGELRTRIRVVRREDLLDELGERMTDGEGVPILRELNVFGDKGATRRCKWEGAWGREVYDAYQAGVTEPATLTMRYTPRVTADCLVYKGDDPRPYEVISVNDVGDRHLWLEVKVQRKGAAV